MDVQAVTNPAPGSALAAFLTLSAALAAVARECALGARIAPVPANGLALLIRPTHAAGAPAGDSALTEGSRQPRREPST